MGDYIWLEIAAIVGGVISILGTYYRQKYQKFSGIRVITGYSTGVILLSAGVILLLLDYMS